jgi:predicted GNAT family acetyltransferase
MAISVTDVPERERFEAREDSGEVAGFMTYQVTGAIIAYTHTEVMPQFEGRGVGSQIALAVMDDARARGRTVVPLCPFLVKWLEKHHEFDDLVVRATKKVK